MMTRDFNLPAAQIAPALDRQLSECGVAVVTAPPGAGKSTLLPLTIQEGLGNGAKVVVLEPRRIAARQIASRMAQMLGCRVGEKVGYRVRFDSCTGPSTRIEVVTEGIFLRMLVDDPTLDGVDAVVFDEFHERSLDSDVALAMVRQMRSDLRPELKLVIMSATIDAEQICRSLGAQEVSCQGRIFPVETIYADTDPDPSVIAETVARWVCRALREREGDILAFLPGEGEIRRCAQLLEPLEGGSDDTDLHGGTGVHGTGLNGAGTPGEKLTGGVEVHPLYGNLPLEEQQRSIMPSPYGRRKVVLATPVAETSLTIEGVRVVIDSGFYRRSVVDPTTSLGTLQTARISTDMADQRRGRAGRVAPGVCYRLWTKATDARMAKDRTPEILEADLAPVLLDIAAWGCAPVQALPWLTPPPRYSLEVARSLLGQLGAVDERCNLTPVGRAMHSVPCHPRIANMIMGAGTVEQKALACDIAALLEEKDPMGGEDCALDLRVDMLRSWKPHGGKGSAALMRRIAMTSDQYRRMVHAGVDGSPADALMAGALLARAYPERIGHADPSCPGRFLLSGGGMASVGLSDPLSASEWIVVASMNPRKDGAGKVFLACPADPADLDCLASDYDNVGWDGRRGEVVCRRERRLGNLVLSSRQLEDCPDERIYEVIAQAARKDGASMFDFDEKALNLSRRIASVASWHPELGLPCVDADALYSCCRDWLPMYASGVKNIAGLRRIDMSQVIWGMLDYGMQQTVDRLAPSHLTVPTGSRIALEYRVGATAPVLRVRLQECFGMTDTPRVDGGTLPVLMELLSPGYKPVQLTSDLHSFWQDTYFEVRKELRRRYPRHSWPDNPLEAEAVRGVRRKS